MCEEKIRTFHASIDQRIINVISMQLAATKKKILCSIGGHMLHVRMREKISNLFHLFFWIFPLANIMINGNVEYILKMFTLSPYTFNFYRNTMYLWSHNFMPIIVV